MRTINRVIWHCTATPEGRDVTAADVRRWHVQERGWSDIGYHFLIRLDGTVENGRPVAKAGAHVQGHNADSIGIAYAGGLDNAGRPKDTRTAAQRRALYALTERLIAEHGLNRETAVTGHNDYAAKACPSFDAKADWRAYLRHETTDADLLAHSKKRLNPQFPTPDADPIREAANKPSAVAKTTTAAAVAAGAPVATAVFGAPWQTVAVVLFAVVALVAVAMAVKPLRLAILRRLGVPA